MYFKSMYLFINGFLKLYLIYSYLDDLYAYIARRDGQYECTVCTKQFSRGFNARRHVEDKHFPGKYEYPCVMCGEVLPTRNKFDHHMSKSHPHFANKPASFFPQPNF